MADREGQAFGKGGAPVGPALNGEDSDLRATIRVFKTWWWLLVLGAVVAAGISLLISRSTQPIYEAHTTVFIQPTDASGLPSNRDLEGTTALAAQIEKLVTLRDNLGDIAASPDVPYTGEELEAKIDAHASGSLVVIVASDSNPAMAALLADSAAKVFIEQYRNSQLVHIAQFQGLLSQYGLEDVQNIIAAQVAALSSMRIVESAAVPTTAVAPRTDLDAALAAGVGLIASLLLALGIERMDDRVRSAARAQEFVTLPMLGLISRRRRRDLDVSTLASGPDADRWTSQFAFIHTNVEFSLLGNGDEKMVLVTSARPREGKTTVATHLAIAAAKAGQRVVLVDLDLQAPSLHRLLDVSANPGFTDAVIGSTTVEDVLRETCVSNLRVMPAGRTPPHSTAVLRSERARSLISRLKDEADLVVLDSPPCLSVPDALIIAAMAEGTLIVVSAKTTKRGMLTEAVRSLEASSASLLGTVLNFANDRKESYYGYDYGRANSNSWSDGVGSTLKRLVGLDSD